MQDNEQEKRKSYDGNRNPVFNMRVDPELREKMDTAAKGRGLSTASWVKMLVGAELERTGKL